MNAEQHDSDLVKQFFDRWRLYQQVIEHNYMGHRGIHAALREFVTKQIDQPFTLLDLGCGDASAILSTFAGKGLQAYTGVDVSSAALSQAAENMAIASFEVNLVEDDLTHYLTHCAPERFHVILAGFALHHLYPEEKRVFFKGCRAALEKPGWLLLYDVFRRPGETRDEYMGAYSRYCREQWTQLSGEGIASVLEHVFTCDFPETYETLAMMAMEAGFIGKSTPLFVDVPQFHCLHNFQTISARA